MKKNTTYIGHKKRGKKKPLMIAFALLFSVAGVLAVVLLLEDMGIGADTSSLPAATSSDNLQLPSSSAESSAISSALSSSSQESSSAESSSEVSSPVSSQVSSQQTSSLVSVSSQSVNTEINDWRLILVNKNNRMAEDYNVTLAVAANSLLMDSRVTEALQDFLAAAKGAGYPLQLISGYRSVERQTTLYNNKVNQYIAAGYTQANAEVESSKWVAIPGTSEHHTGLAADIITMDYYNYFSDLVAEFDTTDAFKWMVAHCAEYGFVLRYTKDKTEITQIAYEPWHYRFVGVEHAEYMMENNLCLEEYVEYLSQQ